MNSLDLFEWASKYADRAERTGRGTQWPTIRQAKRRFKGSTYQDFCDACDCYDGDGYLGLGVGVGMPGFGYAETKNPNDHVIEAY